MHFHGGQIVVKDFASIENYKAKKYYKSVGFLNLSSLPNENNAFAGDLFNGLPQI